MNAFVLFPTVCVFVLTLTVLTLNGNLKPLRRWFWSTVIAVGFGTLAICYSVRLFPALYFAHFLGVIVLLPCLTYLINSHMEARKGADKWLQYIGVGLASVVLTLLLFATLFFIALAYNPMDPGPRQSSKNTATAK